MAASKRKRRQRGKQDPPPVGGGWGPRVLVAAGLFVFCLVAYLINGRTLPLRQGGDTIPNRLLPFAVLAHGTLTLDPFVDDLAAAGIVKPWYTREVGGSTVSLYPPGTGLVALPLFVAPYHWLKATGRADDAELLAASEGLEKVAAAVIAAASVVVTYLAARRLASPSGAMWIGLGLGLGTSIWATASQMLWQHGVVALAIAAGLLLLGHPDRPSWTLAAAGLVFGVGAMTRPSAALMLAAAVAWVALRSPLRTAAVELAWLLSGAVPPLLATALYNQRYFDNFLGAYGLMKGAVDLRRAPLGLAGLLVSPNRGLLVFTPIALLGIYGLVRCAWKPSGTGLGIFGIAAILHGVLSGAYYQWAGGWSFGPRYLVDVLPILALGAALVWRSLGGAWKWALAGALLWSVAVQLDGSFCYPASNWNQRMLRAGSLERAAWSWDHFELWQDYEVWRRGDGTATPW